MITSDQVPIVYRYQHGAQEISVSVEPTISMETTGLKKIQEAVTTIALSPEEANIQSLTLKKIEGHRVTYTTGKEGTEKTIDIGENVAVSSKDFALQPTHHIVEHFLKFPPKEKENQSPIVKLTREFIRPFKQMFESIGHFFSQVTGKTAKQMAWDFSLLQDAIGNFPPDGKVTRFQATRYCRELLEKERGFQRQDLIERLSKAEPLAKGIEKLRKQKLTKPNKQFHKLVSTVTQQIEELPEKSNQRLLIPVGFKQGDNWIDFWMEVEKTAEGKCNLKMISLNPETEAFFSTVSSDKQKGRAIAREYRDVDLKDFLPRVRTLMELQLLEVPAITDIAQGLAKAAEGIIEGEKKLKIPDTFNENANRFFKMLDFPNAKLVKEVAEPIKTMGHSVSKVQELMRYMELAQPADFKRFEIASHVRIFTDICGNTNRWLDDDHYRLLVQSSGRKIIEMLEKERSQLFGKDVEVQNREIELVLSEVKKVLERIELHIPKIPSLSSRMLSSKLSGAMTIPKIWKKGPPKGSKKVVSSNTVDIPPIAIFPENPTPKNVQEVLEQWTGICKVLDKNREYPRLERCIILMANQLDLKSPVWANFSKEELAKLSESLTALSHDLLKARAQQFGRNTTNHLPRATIACISFIAALDKAMEKYPELQMPHESYLRERCSSEIDEISRDAKIMRGLSVKDQDRLKELQLHQALQRKAGVRTTRPNFKTDTEIASYYASLYDKAKTGIPTLTEQDEVICQHEVGEVKPENKSLTPPDVHRKAVYAFTDMGDKGILPPEIVNQRKMIAMATMLSDDFSGVSFPRSPLSLFSKLSIGVKNRLKSIEKFEFGVGGKSWLSLGFFPGMLAGKELYGFWIKNPTLLISQGGGRNEYSAGQLMRFKHQNIREEWGCEWSLVPPMAKPIEKKILPSYLSERNPRELNQEQVICNIADNIGKEIAPEILKELTPEEVRDLLDCEVAGRSSFNQVLITFSKHPLFFQRPELQWYFEYHILGLGNDILSYLYTNKLAINNLVDRLLEMYKTASAAKDLQSAVFLLGFLDRIDQKTQVSKIDAIKQLQELAAKFREPEDQKTIYREILKIYASRNQSPNTASAAELEKQLPEIIYGHLAINALPPSKRFEDPTHNDLIAGFMEKIMMMVKENPQAVSEAMARLYPDFEGKNFVCGVDEFPMFTLTPSNEGECIQVDIKQGVCYRNGIASGKVSDEVSNDPLFADFFKGHEDSLFEWSVSYEKGSSVPTVTYTCSTMPSLRIIYQEAPSVASDKIPHHKVTILKNVNKPGKNPHWMQLVPFDSSQVPPHIWPAIEGRHCWADTNNPSRIVILEKTGVPYGTMNIQKNKKGFSVSSLKRSDGLVLMNVSEHPEWVRQFSTIDKPEQILVYGKNNKAREIEYPLLKLPSGDSLRYKIGRGGKNITLDIIEGYKLMPKGKLPGRFLSPETEMLLPRALPSTFNDYHLFETGTGRQKVLIAAREKVQLEKREQKLIEEEPAESTASLPVFLYDVDLDTNRLESVSVEGNLLLAYINMTHGDYASALYYLKKSETALPLSEQALAMMQWIRNWRDISPNGTALKLHAELQMTRNLNKQTEALATQRGQETYLEQVKRLTALAMQYMPLMEQDVLELAKSVPNVMTLFPELEKAEPKEKRVDPQLALNAADLQLLLSLTLENIESMNPLEIMPPPILKGTVPKQPISETEATKLMEVAANVSNKSKIAPLSLALWRFMRPFSDKKSEQLQKSFLTSGNWLIKDFKILWEELLNHDPSSEKFRAIVSQIESVQPLQFKSSMSDTVFGITSAMRADARKKLLQLAEMRKEGKINESNLAQFRMPERANRPSSKPERAFKALALHLPTESLLMGAGLEGAKKPKGYVGKLLKIGCFAALLTLFNPWWPFPFKVAKMQKKKGADEAEVMGDYVFGTKAHGVLKTMTTLFDNLDKIYQGAKGPASRSGVDAKEMVPEIAEVPKEYAQSYDDRFETPSDREKAMAAAGGLMAGLTAIGKAQQAGINKAKIIEAKNQILLNKIENPTTEPAKIPVTFNPLATQLIPDQHLKDLFIEKKGTAEWDPETFITVAEDAAPAVVRLTQEQRKDFAAFSKDQFEYTLKQGAIETIEKTLQDTYEKQKVQERELLNDILKKVNYFEGPKAILEAQRLLGRTHRLSIDMLIGLWLNNELTIAGKDNPLRKLGLNLSDEEIAKLEEQVCQFMALNSQNGHIERTMALAKSVSQSIDKKGNVIEGELLANLYASLTTERQYQIPGDANFKELLAIEYFNGLIVRGAQLKIFRDMLSDPCAVRQLPMGGGKSKVILPLLAKQRANGKNLVMLVLPEWLYKTNRQDLDKICREVFGQQLFCFDFDRKSPTDYESLLGLNNKLLQTITDKGFLATTKNSLLSFKHTFKELSLQLENANDDERQDLFKRIEMMASILDLIKERGDIIADEVDSILDIRKETNFALGKAGKMDNEKIEGGAKIMRLILQSQTPEIQKVAKALRENSQASIAPAERKLALQAIAREYYSKHLKHLNLPEDDFVKYATGDSVAVQDGSKYPPYIAELFRDDPEAFREIAVLKAFMTIGFSTTLARPGNVAYGRDPVSGIWTIPYKASNSPVVGSEFDEEIEKIAYTLSDYLQNGVKYEQIDTFITNLRNEATLELQRRRDEGEEALDIDDTAAGKEFAQLVRNLDPGKIFGPSPSLSLFTRREKQLLTNILNKSPEQITEFCEKYVLQKITISPEQLSANALDLADMVHNFGGFTGTPWNIHTFHDKIRAQITEGVDGKTYAALFRKKDDIAIRTIDLDVEDPIGSIMQSTQFTERYQALIDAGAYLKGRDNEEFIQAVLQESRDKNIPVAAGVYFNAGGIIVSKAGVHDESIPLAYAPTIDLMNQRTLYDQADTIGADIAQGKKARALVTIGEDTYIKDLFQAIWRLRQLDLQQSIDFCISEKVRSLIKKGQPGTPTLEEIIEFCIRNQAIREAEDNYRAFRHKIKGAPAREAVDGLVTLALKGTGTTEERIDQYVAKVKDASKLFIKRRPKAEAYEAYAAVKKKGDPIAILDEMRTPEEKAAKPLDASLFPEKVEETEGMAQTEVMVQQQTQTEQQVEAEVRVETHAAISRGDEKVQEISISHVDFENLLERKPVTAARVGFMGVRVQSNSQVFGNLESILRAGFDPAIFATYNYDSWIPQFGEAVAKGIEMSEQDVADQTAKIFHSTRKPIHQALFCKQNGQWTVVLLAIKDAANTDELINLKSRDQEIKFYNEEAERYERLADRARTSDMKEAWLEDAADYRRKAQELAALQTHSRVALRVGVGTPGRPLILATNAEPGKGLEGSDRKEFFKLYAQVKFLNGDMEFSGEEKEGLMEWLSEEPQKKREFFERWILPTMHTAKASYPRSTLFKIFQQVAPKQAGTPGAAPKTPRTQAMPPQQPSTQPAAPDTKTRPAQARAINRRVGRHRGRPIDTGPERTP